MEARRLCPPPRFPPPLRCDKNENVKSSTRDPAEAEEAKLRDPHRVYKDVDRLADNFPKLEVRERSSPLTAAGLAVSARCSGCHLPWDKGKRRRLVEACGHARCAACAARSAACPQCAPARPRPRPRLPDTSSDSSTDAGSDDESPLRARLGVLLGGRRRGRPTRRARGAAAHAAALRPARASSMLSLLSVDISPVSTLTGSSEAEASTGLPDSRDIRVTGLDSLPSISLSPAGSFSSRFSRSLTASQDDGDRLVSVPPKYPKYEQDFDRNGHEYYTHSTDTIDSGISVCSQLPLKPLYFEVATSSREPFVGRSRLLSRLEGWLRGSEGRVGAALVSGLPGAGKTALVLQLVERSCFGRGMNEARITGDTDDALDTIAKHVVAYHFCQADNAPTCQQGELVHSIAAQLCQAPQLAAYRRLLSNDPAMLASLTPGACDANPMAALLKGVIWPLAALHSSGALPSTPGLVLVDALCEADYHRPEAGDSLGDFLLNAAALLPPCLRLMMTRRDVPLGSKPPVAFLHFPLDSPYDTDRDVLEYVSLRMESADAFRANVKSPTGKADSFAHYVTSLARGSFLFAKLILNLCESGLIVLKAANYKVIPVSLAQIFTLQFNVRFPTAQSFEKICHILSVCLASLYPLTDDEIYTTVNSLLVNQFLAPEEFHHRMSSLKGFLVKRSDGTNVFFHPAFREWLVRRDAGDADKFLCDLRAGHAALAFRLSRVNAPLDAQRTTELAHHALKAHPFREATASGTARDLLAVWIADASSNTTDALVDLQNAYSPNARVSRLLLLSGALPDANVEEERAPLSCVWAARGETAALRALLDAQASVDAADESGCTALAHASRGGYEEAARTLIAAGADPSATDSTGFTPLSYAAQNGHHNLVSLLLAADGDSPAALAALVAAAAAGHKDIVALLIDAVDSQMDSACQVTGFTALTAACNNLSSAQSGIVEMLVAAGAAVDAADGRSTRALAYAASCGSIGACRTLLDAGSHSCSLDGDARSPLAAAAAVGNNDILLLLLDHGADPCKVDALGRGALWWSCANGHTLAVSTLLTSGASADSPVSSNGLMASSRPLLACRLPPVAEILMAHGADPERIDPDGLRLIDKHIIDGNLPMISCLLKKGVKLGPNTWSAANGKAHIIGMLVNKLLDDGNSLYRRGELAGASHRYNYALRHLKIPPPANPNQLVQTHQYLTHLKANLLLNLARCKRKLNESEEALEVALAGASLRPLCWEGWYGVARAARAAGHMQKAVGAARRALALLPPQSPPHLATALHILIKEGT